MKRMEEAPAEASVRESPAGHVRNFHFGRARRIAWSEISHFADGRYTKEGSTGWQLDIILRTGKRVPVPCSILESTGETLAAVRQVAERYGIPADLAGSPAKNGRPAVDGLHEDPGGQGGLRYWHGRRWSPLLPPDVGKQKTVRKSHGSWSALPTAEGRWTGAATLAMRSAVWFAVIALCRLRCWLGGCWRNWGGIASLIARTRASVHRSRATRLPRSSHSLRAGAGCSGSSSSSSMKSPMAPLGRGTHRQPGAQVKPGQSPDGIASQVDSPTSEPDPDRVGHSWDATQPPIEHRSITAGHRPKTNSVVGELTTRTSRLSRR